MFSNHYNDLIQKTKFISTFIDKYYFCSYYNNTAYFYGVIIVITNRGIFDIYKLEGVSFVSENTLKIQPSLSLDSNKSAMYIHNINNNKYEMQIMFTDKFSHGNVIFGGSIAEYYDIIWYR